MLDLRTWNRGSVALTVLWAMLGAVGGWVMVAHPAFGILAMLPFLLVPAYLALGQYNGTALLGDRRDKEAS